MAARPEHAVEEFITGAGRTCCAQALQDHLDARAAAEPRLAEVTGADQVARRRAEPGHTRLLVDHARPGRGHPDRLPGTRGCPICTRPTPGSRCPTAWYSFPLQQSGDPRERDRCLREARDGLDRILGTRVGTRQLMQITVDAARDVRDFYRPASGSRRRPPGDSGEPGPRDLLVLSIDATGINMIDSGLRESRTRARDNGPRPPSAQLACRERTGRTRMAVVTAVYDAAPAVRGPADVMPADATERGHPPARPESRQPPGRRVDRRLHHPDDPPDCSTGPSNATPTI